MSVFHLPDLGEGLAEASIVEWHVAAGDEVVAEQLLVSVETAKAVVDIPSPQDGRIKSLLAKAGDILPTHAPLLEFAGADGSPEKSPGKTADAGSVVGVLAQEGTIRQENFVIGRHRHTEARLQQAKQRRQKAASTKGEKFAGGEALDLTRRTMAENLARAHDEVVPVTLTAEADIGFEHPLDITTRLIRALVAGAAAEPALNAWYDSTQQKRLLHAHVHVGIAVDTPHGLFVPVLQEADTLSPESIREIVHKLRQAALERKLRTGMQQGATLTLSNFGTLIGHFATPLVSPPQVAILGAGRWQEVLRPSAAGPKTARTLPLSLSVDHRAVTGGEAARFLAAVVNSLARSS